MKDDLSDAESGDDDAQPDHAGNDSPEQSPVVSEPDLLDSTFQVAKHLPADVRKNVERFPFRLSDNVPTGVKLIVLTVKGYPGK